MPEKKKKKPAKKKQEEGYQQRLDAHHETRGGNRLVSNSHFLSFNSKSALKGVTTKWLNVLHVEERSKHRIRSGIQTRYMLGSTSAAEKSSGNT